MSWPCEGDSEQRNASASCFSASSLYPSDARALARLRGGTESGALGRLPLALDTALRRDRALTHFKVA